MKLVSFLFKGYSQTTGAPVYCSQVERTTVSGGSSTGSCGLPSRQGLTSWKLDLNATFFVNSILVEAVSNDPGSPQIAHVPPIHATSTTLILYFSHFTHALEWEVCVWLKLLHAGFISRGFHVCLTPCLWSIFIPSLSLSLIIFSLSLFFFPSLSIHVFSPVSLFL